ncbi:MAG: tripartite tricarboxylate transporter substrate binding protein [Burkholderiales bacterium]
MKTFASYTAALIVTGALAPLADAAEADAYPARPVRILVPYTPGTTSDIIARLVGIKLGATLGQQVVIENREGAAGTIAAGIAARANPDGYTLLLAQASFSVAPFLFKKLPYDPSKDFSAITLIAMVPNVLVTSPTFPANSMKELIALAKTQPGKLQYAHSGKGSPSHLASEMLNSMAGIKIDEIPYKSSAQALTDAMVGTVAFNYPSMAAVMPHVKAGRVKALAVSSGKRASAMPDVPSMAETVPGYDAAGYYGFVVPAGTSPALVKRLQKDIVAAVTAPDMKERLAAQGADIVGNTPEEFTAFIRRDAAKWSKLIDELKIPKD